MVLALALALSLHQFHQCYDPCLSTSTTNPIPIITIPLLVLPCLSFQQCRRPVPSTPFFLHGCSLSYSAPVYVVIRVIFFCGKCV